MRERMEAGDLYIADDPEIAEAGARALDLMAAYNATSVRQGPLRRDPARAAAGLDRRGHRAAPSALRRLRQQHHHRRPLLRQLRPRGPGRRPHHHRRRRPDRARTSSCSPPPTRSSPSRGGRSGRPRSRSPSATTSGSAAARSCCPASASARTPWSVRAPSSPGTSRRTSSPSATRPASSAGWTTPRPSRPASASAVRPSARAVAPIACPDAAGSDATPSASPGPGFCGVGSQRAHHRRTCSKPGQPVPRPAGPGQLVPLPREQQQLRRDAAALELDVEPGALLDRAAPVLLGVDDQGRRRDRPGARPARSARRCRSGSVPRYWSGKYQPMSEEPTKLTGSMNARSRSRRRTASSGRSAAWSGSRRTSRP